ncbi:MAG: DinB family protein [Gemmatimonadota bacterium]
MSHRAYALASRLESGAAILAELVEDMTDAQWNTRVRDGRTIGVIVHHVASMYPIEMDVARTVASGQAVAGVTWEFVAEINAKHAKEFSAVTKQAALELLHQNSKEAAAGIRRLTDLELDTSAPFSLAYDAPMTAQFVLEDHAVRHSWHHVARIRAALGLRQSVAA